MPDITARPTAGYRYRVVAGDRLDNIEKAAYGFVTRTIEPANPQLSGRRLSLENRPTIYPGDILTIPQNPQRQRLKTEAAALRLQGQDANSITIIIDGLEILYDSARVTRTMNTAADGCTCRIAWNPGREPELDRRLLPYSFPPAQVYIGGELVINGILFTVATEAADNGLTASLEIWSFAADVIDSTMPQPYSANNITLLDRANQLLSPIGISAEFTEDSGGAFDRVTGEITDTIFEHLAGLAQQRGFLISSTPQGNLIFQKTTQSSPVGTLRSGDPLPLGWGAKYEGRNIYNVITAIGESPGNNTRSASVTDDNVPRSRFMTFKADDTTDGDIQSAANWRRTKQFADALSLPFPVSGFYAPNGELWKENTQVTIYSPEIFVPNGFTFLIRQVEYVSENSGQSATLQIVPPTVYTGERIVLPWEAS